jgi:hypothetical protein
VNPESVETSENREEHPILHVEKPANLSDEDTHLLSVLHQEADIVNDLPNWFASESRSTGVSFPLGKDPAIRCATATVIR